MGIKSNRSKGEHLKPRTKKTRTPKNKGENKIKILFNRFKDWFMGLPKRTRVIAVTLTSIILVLTIIIGIVLGVIADLTKDLNYNDLDDDELEEIVPISEGIVNIALFGIDSRSTKEDQKFEGLSDSIMILSINTDTGKINIISVMRDSLVEIPGKKVNKINSAYSLGGAALAIKTLNHNFNLDIKEYATVNFFGMSEIIDAVGGIEVDVQKNEIDGYRRLNDLIYELAGFMGVEATPVKKAGLQTLNGMQAVSWARIRAASTAEGESNDYGRTDRQRFVMEQLLNKALATSVSEYPKLIKALLPYMETSLSYSEIIKLAGVLTKEITFEQTRVPQHSYTLTPPAIKRVGSSVYYNLDFAADIIRALIYDGISQDDYIETNGVVKKGWYTGPTSSGSSSQSGGGDTSSDNTSSGSSNSNDNGSNDNSSKNESSKNDSSKDESSKDDSSKDESSKDESSKDGSSKDESSKDEGSGDDGSGSDDDGSEENKTPTIPPSKPTSGSDEDSDQE